MATITFGGDSYGHRGQSAPQVNTYQRQAPTGGMIRGGVNAGPALVGGQVIDSGGEVMKGQSRGRDFSELARGVEAVGRVAEAEVYARDETRYAEAVSAFMERKRLFMLGQAERKGRAALDQPDGQKGIMAETDDFFTLNFNEMPKFETRRVGEEYQKFLNIDRQRSLEEARRLQVHEEGQWKQSVFDGRVAMMGQVVAENPEAWLAVTDDEMRLWQEQNPGLDPTAKRLDVAARNAEKAIYGSAYKGDWAQTGRILNQAGNILGPEALIKVQDIIDSSAIDSFGSLLSQGNFDAARTMLVGSASSAMLMPVDGARLSSPFGQRPAPAKGASTNHQSIDLAAPEGSPIKAAADGVVIFAGDMGGYGNTIVIRHGDGTETQYAHMKGFTEGLEKGATVQAGQLIGGVGSTGISTGPHLDFKVKKGGQWVDPSQFIGTGSDGQLRPSGAALAKMYNVLDKAEAVQIKALHDQEIAALDQADSEFKLTPEMVLAARHISHDEKLTRLKWANGDGGIQGFVKTQRKTELDNAMILAIVNGDVVSPDDLNRRYADDEFSKYFGRQDYERHKGMLDKEGKEIEAHIKGFLALNPIKDELDRELFKFKAVKAMQLHRFTSDKVTEIDDLMTALKKDNVYKRENAEEALPFSLIGREDVLEGFVARRVEASGLDDTEYTRGRAEEAIRRNVSIKEVPAPGAKEWAGEGLMTLKAVSAKVSDFKNYIEDGGNSYNQDPNLIAAFAQAVSGGDSRAVSRLAPGAAGIMQMNPDIAKEFGVADVMDARESIFGAARLLAELSKRHHGNLELMVADYAAGMGMPDEHLPAFVKEVKRIYKDNYGLMTMGPLVDAKYQPRQYKLPVYKD